MNHRRVFSAPDVRIAEAAIAAARANGIRDACISLVARSDVELESIPPERINAEKDTVPAALRGAFEGGSLGLMAGVIAMLVPAFGVTIAGAGLITAIGAMVGTWSSALVGSAVPDAVRRRFETEIERGRILVVVDGDKTALAATEAALAKLGAQPLPFDHLSLTS